MKKIFSILGTGWLGLTLAKKLRYFYNVKVSIRSEEKKQIMINEGLDPYLLNEDILEYLDNLLDADYLFINFPPSKFNNYLLFLNKIYSHSKIQNIKKIIFISSTSIYPNTQCNFDESYNIKNSTSKIVFEVEKQILDKTDVIFRCAGLMGYDRVAGKYFAGKSLDCEDSKVNYVHKDDVIEAVKFIVTNDLNGIFNLCSKEHPNKKDVYTKNAEKFGFTKPIFENKKEYEKRLVNGLKIEEVGFRYKYPNPLEYI
jgi:nucleoside-diphosphate-sugar epimerase